MSEAAQSLVNEVTAVLEPRGAGKRRRRRLVFVERGEEFECQRVSGGKSAVVARGRIDELGKTRLPRQMLSQPLEVRIDGSRVISKVLRLPEASRGYLDAIVRHQLDRATPWSADRVVFDYAIAEDEPVADGQVAVRLVATSRDVLDRIMSSLKAAGLQVETVGTTEDPVERQTNINLLQSENSGRRATLRRKVATSLAALLVLGVILSALSGWHLYSLSARASEVQAETESVRSQIETARAGMSLSDARQRLLAEKQDSVPVVVLLDKLSTTVPTNTYLTEVKVEDGEVHLTGRTADAPALIGILEASDVLADVRFAAPTMRDKDATEDRFEIAARIVQGMTE